MIKLVIIGILFIFIPIIAGGSYVYFFHQDLVKDYLGIGAEKMADSITSNATILEIPVMHARIFNNDILNQDINDEKNRLGVVTKIQLSFPKLNDWVFIDKHKAQIYDMIYLTFSDFSKQTPKNLLTDKELLLSRIKINLDNFLLKGISYDIIIDKLSMYTPQKNP